MDRRRCALAFIVATTWTAPLPAQPKTRISPSQSTGDTVYGRRGKDRVPLTLDPELQRRVTGLLRRSRAPEGAIVMADPRSGRILAWASQGPVDLVRTPQYPAASVAKLVTAAAALEEEVAFRSTPFCFSGGTRRLRAADVAHMCRPGEPRMPFGQALGRSINVIFGRLGAHRLDARALRDRARRLGFDGTVPLDVAAPANRIAYPDERLGRARAAAGFHRGAVSPLGLLYAMTAVAQSGRPRPLRVLAATAPGAPRKALDLAAAHALQRMLRVTTTRGTSRKAFADREGRPNTPAAGKTGTLGWPRPRRLLSWFGGYAPTDAPEVAIAVLLANRPRWWRKANEVARDALDAYFTLPRRARRGPSKKRRRSER
ncbi:MAG: penicillin-binding transpeptidase domain-containing protein [Myxococcota bacterium]